MLDYRRIHHAIPIPMLAADLALLRPRQFEDLTAPAIFLYNGAAPRCRVTNRWLLPSAEMKGDLEEKQVGS